MMESVLSRRLPLVAYAWENLTRARARTALAMAGITIGVVAIASLGMFGAAFEQSTLNRVDDITRSVWLTPGEDAEFEEFSRDHVAMIERSTDSPVYTIKQQSTGVTGLRATEQATVYGLSDPGAFVAAEDGRVPETWRSGAAVGPDLAETLDVGVGDSVTVDGETYRVVAVLESTSRSSLVRTDSAVVLPQSQVETDGYQSAIIREDSPRRPSGPPIPSTRSSTAVRSSTPSRTQSRPSNGSISRWHRSTRSCWASGASRCSWPRSVSST
ncbi:ABC transporter permease [Halomicroarcula sp. GCM10025709]|uniref:ABC transporter permease n=1 Tax=Halomicroarcula sp. GCM10025709 TaxID=3252669 RepID=UPI003611F255